jgi:nicotinamide mononucleotide transporter
MDYIELIKAEADALSWVDWTATITAIIYVVLAARENAWCWFWGIISCSLWAYASFALYGLYLDALLQLFYVGMSAVGLYKWKWATNAAGQTEKPITRLSSRQHFIYLFSGTALALSFGYLFGAYTPAAATYWDAFTTVFSVLATFMLVNKRLDNWAYWVVIDLAYAGLYANRGAYLFALLMIAYTIIAAVAYYRWLNEWGRPASPDVLDV